MRCNRYAHVITLMLGLCLSTTAHAGDLGLLRIVTNAHPRPVMKEMSRCLDQETTIRVECADTRRIGSHDLRGGEVVAQVLLAFGSLEAIRHSCAVIGADYYDYLDEMGIEWPVPETGAITEAMPLQVSG